MLLTTVVPRVALAVAVSSSVTSVFSPTDYFVVLSANFVPVSALTSCTYCLMVLFCIVLYLLPVLNPKSYDGVRPDGGMLGGCKLVELCKEV